MSAATATLRFVRMSPRRMRLVADLVRGKQLGEALNILRYSDKKAAGIIKGLVESAMANAEQKAKVDVDSLVLKTIFVNPGPTMKRFMPRAMGRANRICKRSSHVYVALDEAL